MLHHKTYERKPLACYSPNPKCTPRGIRIILLPLLPRAMQLESDIMFFAPDIIKLHLKCLLPMLHNLRLLKIRQERVRRRGIVEVSEEAVDIVAADAKVFLLGF